MSCSAVTASRARLCRRQRYLPRSRSRPTTTSTPPCQAMCVAAAPTSASVPPSTEQRVRERGLTMPESPCITSLDRRSFLKVGAAVGGGLALPLVLPSTLRSGWAAIVTASDFAPNAFIRISRDGVVTMVMPMVEMGQGIYTSMATLLAEELEVDLNRVRLEHAPPNDALYGNSLLHVQTTGLSASIRAFWTPLRQAGAVGPTLPIAPAAKEWGGDPSTCRAKHRVGSSAARRLSHRQFANAAAPLPVPTPCSEP